MTYYRPLPCTDSVRPKNALPLAGGWCWFDRVERIEREGSSGLISVDEVPEEQRARLSNERAPIAGLQFDAPRLMGILNVTPDSFSDGGVHFAADQAIKHCQSMVAAGANIIDIGGESTRPGAAEVDISEEVRRTAPVIEAVRNLAAPISIDTRKFEVARAAYEAGATLVNDVSGLEFDPKIAPFCVDAGLPVCVMHSQGTPEVMQKNPRYSDVVLDVYDYLEARVNALCEIGIAREKIIIDPGIGFGKTLEHNLALLQNLSLFHGIGCAVLLGASRKRFIGTIGGSDEAHKRVPGSLAVALAGVAQGVQVLRVHDVGETSEAIKLWNAATLGRK